MPAPRLSTSTARTLAPGEELHDHEVKGLSLRAGPDGKSWLYYYRVDGQRRRPKLGAFPTLGIDDAREAAREIARRVATGADPSAERQARRAALTMTELFERYARERGDKRSIDQDRRNWAVHLAPRVGRIKADAFSLADADSALEAIGRERWVTVPLAQPIGGRMERKIKRGGRVAANRCRALLSGLLKFAERDTVRARPRGSNFIMSDTRLNPERPRRRHVRREEFPRVFAALETHAARYPREVAALWASLYSGTRVSELLLARRAWLEGSTLRLFVHKTMEKTGQERRVILPRQALALIAEIPPTRDGLLFGASIDRFRIGKVWRSVAREAGCPDVQPRDIRRTFASVGRTAGLTLDRVADLLGHSGDVKTTAGYAYIFEDERTSNAQAVADQMDRMAERGKP